MYSQPAGGELIQTPADGKCIIEPVLKDNVETAVATWSDFIPAAFKLLNTCAIPLAVGGIATDIGMYHKRLRYAILPFVCRILTRRTRG